MKTRSQREPQGPPATLLNENDFVVVAGSSDGYGKVISVSGANAEVEYFISPVGPQTRTVSVPIEIVRRIELPPQTRVFWFDSKQSAWRIGRVDGGLVSAQALRAAEDHYHVRFPNQDDDRIPCSQLYTRWAHPIEDPTEHLAARITESPLFFDGRQAIVRHLASEHATFGGLTALASSAVEFFEHQVSTVRRVLSDPVQRYLLADEVGLGKTIEAGVIIRQHVLDQPGHATVLIVVPEHLASQWERELTDKFFLTAPKPVRILTEKQLTDDFVPQDDCTMLVVDEAHRAANRAFSEIPSERRLYDRLRKLSTQVPRVLLLSGTPVLHNEDGFLAMLHLIDPSAYRLDDREAFGRRVRERQTVAECVLDLPDDAGSLFAEEAIERLRRTFPDDDRLERLATSARSVLSRSDVDPERRKAIGQLRRHLVESYRLHRRLLRTRRDDPRLAGLLPSRTTPIVVTYEDPAREEVADALESWRHACLDATGPTSDSQFDALFTLFVETSFSHPRVFLDTALARLNALQGRRRSAIAPDLLGLPPAFPQEVAFWSERVRLIEQYARDESRAVRLAQWLAEDKGSRKVVVFCDQSSEADAVSNVLTESLGIDSVLRHRSDDNAAQQFETVDTVRILVCDANAEEGLNLQRVGATVVHYGIPLESTRIEQRIGRVDRLEAARNVRTVLLSAGVRYEREWLRCLLEAVLVFERSIAPLQYALLESAERVRATLLEHGAGAIEEEQRRLQDPERGLDQEMRRILSQEALDSADDDPDESHAFFERLVDGDTRSEATAREAFDGWLVRLLQFDRRNNGPISQYVHLSGFHRQTLTPLVDAAARFQALVDRTERPSRRRGELPLATFTFDRTASEQHAIPLLRIGHPLVSAVEAMMREDDRGSAFAMWRIVKARGLETPRLFLRFDFVIEADLAAATVIVDEPAPNRESLRRRADKYFPVQHRTVWLTSDLKEVTNSQLIEVLQRPYRSRKERGADLNLRPDRWPTVDAAITIADWQGLCSRARVNAEHRVRAAETFVAECRSASNRLRTEAAANQDLMSSRIAKLSGATQFAEERAAQFEAALAERLAEGIDTPAIRVDAAGAVFLAATPLSEETT